jgi:hypothetical protein
MMKKMKFSLNTIVVAEVHSSKLVTKTFSSAMTILQNKLQRWTLLTV